MKTDAEVGDMQISIKFEGGLASAHKIPAYDGSKSIEGFTRSIMIVSNYISEGRVRRKKFGKTPMQFNLLAQKEGSYEALFEVLYGPVGLLGGSLTLAVAGNLLTDLLKTVYARVVGGDEDNVSLEMKRLESERAGDIMALTEAIEPSVRLGHEVINNGVMNINIYAGIRSPTEGVGRFNRKTKEFLKTSIDDDKLRDKNFSIAIFNATQGTGRAYDFEEGHTVPFELANDVDAKSIETLIFSFGHYLRRRRLGEELISAVAIRYTSVVAGDGRVKKIIIHKARRELEELYEGATGRNHR